MQNNIDWDKATAGPKERDHLPDCPINEGEDDCICAEIEADLGIYWADRAYDEYKDDRMEAKLT